MHSEQMGKIFEAVGHDRRRCLIGENTFSRQAAAQHALTVCQPTRSEVLDNAQGTYADR
jgi:hypothetical protein